MTKCRQFSLCRQKIHAFFIQMRVFANTASQHGFPDDAKSDRVRARMHADGSPDLVERKLLKPVLFFQRLKRHVPIANRFFIIITIARRDAEDIPYFLL